MKKKKKMNPQTKENLKNIFGSLYSNQRAIDGARHNRWWVALIMFVFSVLLPVIPITVNASQLHGTTFFSSGLKGFDTTITDFAITSRDEGIALTINDKNRLEDVDNKWKETYQYYDSDNKGIQYNYLNENSGQYDLLVYFINPLLDGASFNNTVNEILAKRYVLESATLYVAPTESEDSIETPALYRPTTLIFGSNNVILSVYQPNSIDLYGTVNGDYLHTEPGTILQNFAIIDGNIADINKSADVTVASQRWLSFFDETFVTFKNNQMLFNSLLALGIYIVLGAFMGLMIFLLTRGKKNIFRIYTFGDCEKIVSWAMVSPAILSLILGFIFKDYAMMFFIILIGLRVMWLSMKQLQPVRR